MARNAKGAAFELDVARYLRTWWPQADRKKAGASLDRGDISDITGWCLELKNEARLNFSGALTEAEAEAKNAGAPWFAAIVKRAGRGVAEAYAVMPLRVFAALAAGGAAGSPAAYSAGYAAGVAAAERAAAAAAAELLAPQ